MIVDSLLALPRWVLVGLSVGALVSVAVATTFLVAPRLYPDSRVDQGPRRSSETRRRREIGRYLDAVGERYETDADVAGRTVAFYLPHRDVAVTFDARTYYTLERTSTRPVLVEHEMPGVALGHRLPFETPEVTTTDDSDADPAETAYAVLGLPIGAGEADIRRAYRTRVKEVHPDHGGTETEFHRVRKAYRTASEHAT